MPPKPTPPAIPNSVTEAVARAISNSRDGFTESGASLVSDYDRGLANAAILAHLLAIREPTPEMIMAGIIERHETGTPEAWKLATANIYTVMIDQLIASAREATA